MIGPLSRAYGAIDQRQTKAQRAVFSADDLTRTLTEIAANGVKGVSILIAQSFKVKAPFTLPRSASGLSIVALPSCTITIGADMDYLFQVHANFTRIEGVHAVITSTSYNMDYLVNVGDFVYGCVVTGNHVEANALSAQTGGLVDAPGTAGPSGSSRSFSSGQIANNMCVHATFVGTPYLMVNGSFASSVIIGNTTTEKANITISDGSRCVISSNSLREGDIATSASAGSHTIVGNSSAGTITNHALDFVGLNS